MTSNKQKQRRQAGILKNLKFKCPWEEKMYGKLTERHKHAVKAGGRQVEWRLWCMLIDKLTDGPHCCWTFVLEKTNKNLVKLFNKMQSVQLPHEAAGKGCLAIECICNSIVLHVNSLCCTLVLACNMQA